MYICPFLLPFAYYIQIKSSFYLQTLSNKHLSTFIQKLINTHIYPDKLHKIYVTIT